MLRHIDGDRLDFLVVLQGCFAGQLEATIGGQRLCDPMKGAADGALATVIVVGNGPHGDVFPIVFQGEEEFVADAQVIGFAAGFVQGIVGGLQNVEHGLEDGLGRSDSSFEFVA